MRADEKLTAFIELEAAIRAVSPIGRGCTVTVLYGGRANVVLVRTGPFL